jgi:hypothetical protein
MVNPISKGLLERQGILLNEAPNPKLENNIVEY